MTSRLRSEEGFTLVEVLVVMVSGIVVLGALFTILDVTLHQTTATYSKIDASQQARNAVEQIENELHSACYTTGVTPIQTGSSGNSVTFVSTYGSTGGNANAALPVPAQHTITYNPVAKTLTDTTTQASSGSGNSWTFGGASTTKTLLGNASPFPSSGSSTVPVFQYFAYTQPVNSAGAAYVDGAGNPYEMLIDGINAVPGTTPAVIPPAAPLAVPLSAADAQDAAEVLVKLLVMPSNGKDVNPSLASAGASITDQVVLRLTPAANHDETSATFDPCG
jgi:Tfp pilus assembly protein PilV